MLKILKNNYHFVVRINNLSDRKHKLHFSTVNSVEVKLIAKSAEH